MVPKTTSSNPKMVSKTTSLYPKMVSKITNLSTIYILWNPKGSGATTFDMTFLIWELWKEEWWMYHGRVGGAGWRTAGRRGGSPRMQSSFLSSRPSNKTLIRASLWKHEQTNSYVNRWRNTTSGWPAVYQRLIRDLFAGTRALFVPGC